MVALTQAKIDAIIERQDNTVAFNDEAEYDDADADNDTADDEPDTTNESVVPANAVDEPDTPNEPVVPANPDPLAKVTRSNRSYAQVLQEGKQSSRSDRKKNNRCAVRKKKRVKELRSVLKNKIQDKQVRRSKQQKHNLCFTQTSNKNKIEYDMTKGLMMIRCMMQIRDKLLNTKEGVSLVQQYHINKGLKKSGDDGNKAVVTEVDQMLKQGAFGPILQSDLTDQERVRAIDSMMLMTQKDTGEVKGRFV